MLVLLHTFQTRLEAEMLVSRLKSEGIKAIVQGSDLGGMQGFPFSPSNEGISVLVNKEDLKKALLLISQR